MDTSAGPGPSPLAAMGGAAAIERVIHRFYDKVFVHPLLAPFFAGIQRERQEQRLAAFIHMAADSDWMSSFHGQFLRSAHARLAITPEAFEVRRSLLCSAVREEGLGPEVERKWIEFDERWRSYVLPEA